ncbi:DUF397 domain-containing protein [Sphaerisporangium rhizosphaerae]|uniref:DUF397 domain-containing protein n=1 Tax=Sphaerisporangium rhizosphaerae TaxID=2269375 RepID=A0ABW2P0C2_9ACTN
MAETRADLTWRKSTFSGQGENCVEVAALDGGGIAVRDSKQPGGGVLCLPRIGWQAFITGVKSRTIS